MEFTIPFTALPLNKYSVFLFSPFLKELTVGMQEKKKKSRLKKPLIKELQKNEKKPWQNKQVIL